MIHLFFFFLLETIESGRETIYTEQKERERGKETTAKTETTLLGIK